jgi:hypothetical protein
MSQIDSTFMEYNPEFENFEYQEFEWEGEGDFEGEFEVFGEAELMELAGELLSVNSEAELDQFLGDFIKKAGQSIGKVVKSPVGRAIGGALKGLAKKALPIAGSAIGGYFGGPLGAKIGGGLASKAGSMLGLEAETMNSEDREFEGAKLFCRMAADTVKNTVSAPPGKNPRQAAQRAVASSINKMAPGMMTRKGAPGSVIQTSPARNVYETGGRTGKWVRKGRDIVLLNC